MASASLATARMSSALAIFDMRTVGFSRVCAAIAGSRDGKDAIGGSYNRAGHRKLQIQDDRNVVKAMTAEVACPPAARSTSSAVIMPIASAKGQSPRQECCSCKFKLTRDPGDLKSAV